MQDKKYYQQTQCILTSFCSWSYRETANDFRGDVTRETDRLTEQQKQRDNCHPPLRSSATPTTASGGARFTQFTHFQYNCGATYIDLGWEGSERATARERWRAEVREKERQRDRKTINSAAVQLYSYWLMGVRLLILFMEEQLLCSVPEPQPIISNNWWLRRHDFPPLTPERWELNGWPPTQLWLILSDYISGWHEARPDRSSGGIDFWLGRHSTHHRAGRQGECTP